jgi:hypothetical protein
MKRLTQLWFHLEKTSIHSTSGKLITQHGFCAYDLWLNNELVVNKLWLTKNKIALINT